jgi:hypothetical protein
VRAGEQNCRNFCIPRNHLAISRCRGPVLCRWPLSSEHRLLRSPVNLFLHPIPPHLPNAKSSSMSSQPYVKGNFTHCIDQVTNTIPNSLAQTRARRQLSPLSSLSTIRRSCAVALHRLAAIVPGRRKSAIAAFPPSFPTRPEPLILNESASTAFLPPSFPTRPGSSILTDSRSKDSLTTGKHGHRCMSLRNIPQRLLTDSMRCRPGEISRRATRRCATSNI